MVKRMTERTDTPNSFNLLILKGVVWILLILMGLLLLAGMLHL